MSDIDETIALRSDFAQLARLATGGHGDDVRLFLAKAVRKYRRTQPALADEIDEFLRLSRQRSLSPSTPLRRGDGSPAAPFADLPIAADSRLSLLRTYDDRAQLAQPFLSSAIQTQVEGIIRERQQAKTLAKHGLRPTRSVIFVGPPGVGKTLSARWIACTLGKPLWILDLSAVMSSLLGKTGGNVRAALDFAKEQRGVLLLDEIDAIAKRRNDDTDIGELKRLVAVLLQEVDEWPDEGLLLAATNHPEIVDRALWRRFDAVIDFGLPTTQVITAAIERFLGEQAPAFANYVSSLAILFEGQSLSDVERAIHSVRRTLVLNDESVECSVLKLVHMSEEKLSRQQRQQLAIALARSGVNYHEIQRVTGVARDTIRRHAGPSTTPRGRR